MAKRRAPERISGTPLSRVSETAIAKSIRPVLLRYVVSVVESAVAQASRAPVVLDAHLLERFMRWSEEKKNSAGWRRDQRRYLRWWLQVLVGRDLRFVSLELHVLPALHELRARRQRIAAFKCLCSWLVFVEHTLPAQRNPCLGLKCIQATPAQWTRSKVVKPSVIAATRARLRSRYRAALDVLLGTGWHVTELERFTAEAGAIGPRPPGARAPVAAVLVTTHKGGETFQTPVTRAVLRAAQRLRRRRGFCRSRFAKELRAAARAAGVDEWGGGGRLRHTFATNAIAKGASLQAVADVLRHLDKRTTRRFYAVHCTPAAVPSLL
jgi:site-specific recombinase XerD